MLGVDEIALGPNGSEPTDVVRADLPAISTLTTLSSSDLAPMQEADVAESNAALRLRLPALKRYEQPTLVLANTVAVFAPALATFS
jgi:hypothetical protein